MVCTAEQACTAAQVKEKATRHAYPGQDPDTVVQDGGRYLVRDEITGAPGGYVITNISSDGFTIVNTTTPLHVFHDGQVVRVVFQRNGAWFVSTHGFGNNVIPGMNTVNQLFGPIQFRLLDNRLRDALR